MNTYNVDAINKDSRRLLAELQGGFKEERIRGSSFLIKNYGEESFKHDYRLAIKDIKEKIAKVGGVPIEIIFKVLSDADCNFWEDYGQLCAVVLVPNPPELKNEGEKKWLNVEHP